MNTTQLGHGLSEECSDKKCVSTHVRVVDPRVYMGTSAYLTVDCRAVTTAAIHVIVRAPLGLDLGQSETHTEGGR